MRFEIILTRTAQTHYRALSARRRAVMKTELERHLRHEPTKTSRSRIKKLRTMAHPEYRLRVDEYRIFYDVVDAKVIVLAIVPKVGVGEWLDEHGVKNS
jgi:mRNA-degrading endonuclease RelE of RelBE toxin-antitoxin system